MVDLHVVSPIKRKPWAVSAHQEKCTEGGEEEDRFRAQRRTLEALLSGGFRRMGARSPRRGAIAIRYKIGMAMALWRLSARL